MAAETFNVNPNALSITIEFLTAMITPALLISATGSLVLSTSTRLGRVIDRVRELRHQLEEMITMEEKEKVPLFDKRVEVTFDLLDRVTTRARILQKALQALYYGLGFFVLTSITIGIVGFWGQYRLIPIPIGIIGILFVFYSSLQMLRETRLATTAINTEMDFTWELANVVAPEEVASRYTYNVFGRRRIRPKKTLTSEIKTDEKPENV